MWLALSLSLLGAVPDSAVVVARRIGVEPDKALEIALDFTEALRAGDPARAGPLLDAHLALERFAKAGFPDPSVCNGKAACVASLAKVGGFRRLVALQLARAGTSVAVDASLVDGETGAPLASATRMVFARDWQGGLSAIATELLSRWPAEDAPVVTRGPAETAPPVVVTASSSLSPGRTAALAVGGGAVVALGVGIALGVSASAQANQLSVLDPRYDERVAAVRGTALGADVSYIAAGALAVTALVVWLVDPGAAK
ncbi:MAG: hypothetical protein U0228_38855 [Myxococcaceae bacterium]